MPRWIAALIVVAAVVAVAGIILSTAALYVLESRVHALELHECEQYAVLHAHRLIRAAAPSFC